jgi:replicative DNA helicase
MTLWPKEAAVYVLGAILVAGSWSVEAGHRMVRRVQAVGLDPEHFYLESEGALFRTMVRMVDDSLPVDGVSVAAELDRNHADPHVIARLQILAHEVPVASAAERYAQIVIDAATRREIEERSAA